VSSSPGGEICANDAIEHVLRTRARRAENFMQIGVWCIILKHTRHSKVVPNQLF